MQESIARLELERFTKKNDDPKPARDEDRTLKFDVGEFTGTNGTNDVDAYIDWEDALERYFEYKETSEARKVKIVVAKLAKYASIWYNGVKEAREREGKKKNQKLGKTVEVIEAQVRSYWSSTRIVH